jgi:signal transduction histidine kinase
VLFEQQTIVIDDARTDPRWFWQPGTEQVRSWCAAPLVFKGECIGWLCVDRLEPGFYTEQHAQIVRAFADQAVTAIENARLYAAVKDLSDQLEQKVHIRTNQLHLAHDEIGTKAAQLSALIRRVVQVQESERQRIARDLHDGATQTILGAIYELHALRRHVEPLTIAPRLDACVELLDSTLEEMKRIIYALRPRALDELGLVGALDSYAASLRGYPGLQVHFSALGTPGQLEDPVELAIYRIVQEATQNSLRHAQASRITITLACYGPHCRVAIADNGRGFVLDAPSDGLGLIGMRERALALGGQLEIISQPGAGTEIIFELEAPACQSAS